MRDILIHVGYPKTASTWFQNQIFTNVELGFISIPRSLAINDIILPKTIDFNTNSVLHKIESILAKQEFHNSFPVISHEIFVGNPQSGGYNTFELAHRLKSIFDSPYIFIVIRKQNEAIYSTYKQYIRTGGKCKLKDYLFPPIDGRIPLFDFGFFEYDKVIKLYQSIFGKERVKIIPYEFFNLNKETVLKEMLSWLNIKPKELNNEIFARLENASINGIGITIKRNLNSIISRRDSLNPSVPFRLSYQNEVRLEKLIMNISNVFPKAVNSKIQVGIKESINQIIANKYKVSNSITQEITGLNLNLLGYDL